MDDANFTPLGVVVFIVVCVVSHAPGGALVGAIASLAITWRMTKKMELPRILIVMACATAIVVGAVGFPVGKELAIRAGTTGVLAAVSAVAIYAGVWFLTK